MTRTTDLEATLRRRVEWLRTTTAPLPPHITGRGGITDGLAGEIEELLDAEIDRAERVRAACAGLRDLAGGVLAALDGDLDLEAVRDAVGDVDQLGA